MSLNKSSNLDCKILLFDNNYPGKKIENIPSKLLSLGNKSLKSIVDENENLLIFPDKFNLNNEDQELFNYSNLNDDSVTILTGNIVGFIKNDNYNLEIQSRFNKNWFFFYMLSKVYDFNIVESEFDFSFNSSLDLLPLMFIYQLKKARKQGIYKEYVVFKSNDYRPKGTINFARHIKQNQPFLNGKIAYSYRSRSTENNVNYLIRYTYEFLSKGKFSSIIANSKGDNIYKSICLDTEKYYETNINKITKSLLNFIPNPLYNEYRELVKLCLLIINSEKINQDKGDGKLSGILFDVSYFWENYLSKIFIENSLKLSHPDNSKFTGGTNLFSNKNGLTYMRYPDFLSQDKTNDSFKLVCDAKYKPLWGRSISRDDMNQMVTYMYMFKSLNGVFINPVNTTKDQLSIYENEIGTLIGYGNKILVISMPIPSDAPTFSDFVKFMKDYEKKLVDILDKYI